MSATAGRLDCSAAHMRRVAAHRSSSPSLSPPRPRRAHAREPPSRGRPSTSATRAEQPDEIGIRGSMPGTGAQDARMYMRFRVQYRDADERWRHVEPGADSGWRRVGGGRRATLRVGLELRVQAAGAGRRARAARRRAVPLAARRSACSRRDRAPSPRPATRSPPAPTRRTSAPRPARSPSRREQPRVVRDHAGHAERLEPPDPRARRRRSTRRARRPPRARARTSARRDEPPVRHQRVAAARRATWRGGDPRQPPARAAASQRVGRAARVSGERRVVAPHARDRPAEPQPRLELAQHRRGCACTASRRACARPARASRSASTHALLVAGELEVDVELDAGERRRRRGGRGPPRASARPGRRARSRARAAAGSSPAPGGPRAARRTRSCRRRRRARRRTTRACCPAR